jgi:ADP-heptose:LPS heptosyltransferase
MNCMETPVQSQSVERVLVVRVGHLGDSVLATTIIEPLRAAYGAGVSIDFASGPGVSAGILRLDRRLQQVFPISRRRLHWRLNPNKRALHEHARRAPYDIVINLECGDECNDFARFVACREFHGRPFFSHEHALDRHCVDTEKRIYRDLLGAEATDAAEPAILPEATAGAPPERDFVLVNPGFAGLADRGYRSHRGWPAGHWADLIRRITGRLDMAVQVNGAQAELPHLESLLGLPGVSSLVGSALPELTGAIRAARCVISVDTGTMHLATALGTPVIALFGPTIPALTGPYSRTVPCRVITSGVDCQPCDRTPLQKRCDFNRCMAELTPLAAFEALQKLLAESGPGGGSNHDDNP